MKRFALPMLVVLGVAAVLTAMWRPWESHQLVDPADEGAGSRSAAGPQSPTMHDAQSSQRGEPNRAATPENVVVTIKVAVTDTLGLRELDWTCISATVSGDGGANLASLADRGTRSITATFPRDQYAFFAHDTDAGWNVYVRVHTTWDGGSGTIHLSSENAQGVRTPGRLTFNLQADTGSLLEQRFHVYGRIVQGDVPVVNSVIEIAPNSEVLSSAFRCMTDGNGVFVGITRHFKFSTREEESARATASPWSIELNFGDSSLGLGWSEFDAADLPEDRYFHVHATPIVDGARLDFGDIQVGGGMLRITWPDRPQAATALDIVLRSGTAARALRFLAKHPFPVSIPLPAASYEFVAAMWGESAEFRPYMTGTFTIVDGRVYELGMYEPAPQYTRIRAFGPDGEVERATLSISSVALGYPERWDFTSIELPYLLCTTGRERVFIGASVEGYSYASGSFSPPLEELVLQFEAQQPETPPVDETLDLFVRAKVPSAIQNDLEGYLRFVHESGIELHDQFTFSEGALWAQRELPQPGEWTVTAHGGLNWGYGPLLSGPRSITLKPGERGRELELPPLAEPPWDSPHDVQLEVRCEGRDFYLSAPCRMADGRITDQIEVDEEEYPVAVLDGDAEVAFKVVKQADEDGNSIAKLFIDFPARVRVRVNNAPPGGIMVEAEGAKTWCICAIDVAGTEAVLWLPAGPARVYCSVGPHRHTRDIVVPRTGTLEVVFDVETGGARFVCESDRDGRWLLFAIDGDRLTHIGYWRSPEVEAYLPLPSGMYRAVPDIDQAGEVVDFQVNEGQETVVHMPPPRPHETRSVDITLPDAPSRELRTGEFQCMRGDLGEMSDVPFLVLGLQSDPLEWRRTETGIRVLGVPKGVSIVLFGYLGQVEYPETVHWFLKPTTISPQATSATATWVESVPLSEEWNKLDVPLHWKFDGTNPWPMIGREAGMPRAALRLRYLPTRRVTEIKTCALTVGDEAEVPLPPELRALIR